MFSKHCTYIIISILCFLMLTSCYISGTAKELEEALDKQVQITYQKEVSVYDLGRLNSDPSKRVVMLKTDLDVDDIVFSLDGSDPKTSGFIYSGQERTYETDNGVHKGILVDDDTVINAYSVIGNKQSRTLSYSMNNPITINDQGEYKNDSGYHIVSFYFSDTYIDFLYTTDGSAPNEKSSSYNSSIKSYTNKQGSNRAGILVPNNSVVKVMLKKTNRFSPVSLTFVGSEGLESPTIETKGRASGDDNYRLLSITSNVPGAEIYYTTNGQDPDITSNLYVPQNNVNNAGSTEKSIKVSSYSPVKAVVYKDGIYSDVSTIAPLYNKALAVGCGRYDEDNMIVKLETEITDASIYYTIDDSVPTISSNLYEPRYYRNTEGEMKYGIIVPCSTTIRYVMRYNDQYSTLGEFTTEASSRKTITFNTNSQWATYDSSGLSSDLYSSFYSVSNYGMNSSTATMYIDIAGYDEFTIYIRSFAEGTSDYTIAYEVDSEVLEKVNTSDFQRQDGSNLDNYKRVTYTGLNKLPHTIRVSYKKDESVQSNDDRGYLIIEKSQ